MEKLSPEQLERVEYHDCGIWDELLPRSEMRELMRQYLTTKYPILVPINNYYQCWIDNKPKPEDFDDIEEYTKQLTESEQEIVSAFVGMCWQEERWVPILGGFRKEVRFVR